MSDASPAREPAASRPATWVHAAAADAVAEGKPAILTVRGKEIGLFLERGRYYAVLNFCPHYGAPICRGRVTGAVTSCGPQQLGYDAERRVLRCPWHHWEFDLETGRALAAIKERLRVYPVKCEAGQLYVGM
jgi:nitrite reductase (NADH) small subunit